MAKIAVLILIVVLLSACAPSAQAIQTAIAQTQAAIPTLASTATFTPRPTSTPTRTKIPPTRAPSKTTYILETGWCMLDEVVDLSSDPKSNTRCNLDARQQIQLGSYDEVHATLNNLDGRIQVYCALFSVDGAFITADVDAIGTGEVTCRP